MSNYTNIVKGVWQCNDCGGHAQTKEKVIHHKTCQSGESKKWEEIYTKANEEELRGDSICRYCHMDIINHGPACKKSG